MIYALKCYEDQFKAVISGEKSFTILEDNAGYKKGDMLAINEFDYDTNSHTGNSCLVYIDYVQKDVANVKEGYVVLAIKPCGVCRITSPQDVLKMMADYSVPLATKKGAERNDS